MSTAINNKDYTRSITDHKNRFDLCRLSNRYIHRQVEYIDSCQVKITP